MTAADLAVWVNDKLELVEEDHYSARTMVSWLHLCGFKVSTEYYRLTSITFEFFSSSSFSSLLKVRETKRGIYYDGHERPEVVKDRQERFLPAIEALKKEAVWVAEDEHGKPYIINEEKPYLPVSADQKGHHSNERPGW